MLHFVLVDSYSRREVICASILAASDGVQLEV